MDFGHASIAGEVEKYIKGFGNIICHVHMSDNKLHDDDHLPLGMGKINYKKEIFPFLSGFNGIVALEIFSSVNRKNLMSSSGILRKLNEK
jgi:sugar phosphate isomerase/epimerase